MTDALTGLRNQGTFAEQLARTVARGVPFSLLIVDLDDFKSFNDRDGHEAGNRLLQSIAAGILQAGRDSDEVYRYGGDEFAVILPGTTVAGAIEVGRRVGDAVVGSATVGSPAPSASRRSRRTAATGMRSCSPRTVPATWRSVPGAPAWSPRRMRASCPIPSPSRRRRRWT